jgi:hypothetical protein
VLLHCARICVSPLDRDICVTASSVAVCTCACVCVRAQELCSRHSSEDTAVPGQYVRNISVLDKSEKTKHHITLTVF